MEGCSWGRQWVKLDACAASHACERGRGGKLSRLLALHSIFHRQLIVFFSFFVSFAFLFHFGFAFVLFCCYCKQNQHKLKTIINMSGLSDLRSSGKVGGRREGGGVGCVLEKVPWFSAC